MRCDWLLQYKGKYVMEHDILWSQSDGEGGGGGGSITMTTYRLINQVTLTVARIAARGHEVQ